MDHHPHFVLGWNDRVTGEIQYGRCFRRGDGLPGVNCREAKDWLPHERENYVQGWEAADPVVKEAMKKLLMKG